jgi:SAM-dependent methyltransferase
MGSTFAERQKRYWRGEWHRLRRNPLDPAIVAYARPKIEEILRHLSLSGNATILDIGAGNGYFSMHWNELAPTTAVDYSSVILEGNPVERKFVMDARALQFPDATFDLSFCHALLHHVATEDRVQVLREMARVSKRYVAYIEPNVCNPIIAGFSLLKKEERGALRFTPGYVRSLAPQAGLHVLWSAPWGLLTPNRMPLTGVLLPLFRLLERPLPLGVATIVVAEKQ